MTERIAELIDPEEEGLRHVVWREEVVRCRDCGHCRTLPQGCVCDVHGAGGLDACRCPRARERAERLEGRHADWLRCAEVRGTRMCAFEPKGEEE